MIVDQAYLAMFPDARIGDYKFGLLYSNRFNDYNANVKRKGSCITFSLSKRWKSINQDVRIGLIQSLFNKLFRTNVNTTNIELYEIFLKKVHIAVPKLHSDPVLDDSFERMNEAYFCGLIEKPNLKWGRDSVRKLGSYEYGSDTIVISRVFRESDPVLLDYIMYHEMLHKKHKFMTKNGKSFHHTARFRQDERSFQDPHIEQKLQKFIRMRRKRFW